jgi:hypothetical protein
MMKDLRKIASFLLIYDEAIKTKSSSLMIPKASPQHKRPQSRNETEKFYGQIERKMFKIRSKQNSFQHFTRKRLAQVVRAINREMSCQTYAVVCETNNKRTLCVLLCLH